MRSKELLPTWPGRKMACGCALGNGSGGTSCSSDIRLKKDIEPAENALDKIQEISGGTFNWIDPSRNRDRKQLGVIAQEVEKNFPEAFHDNPKTGYKSVDYGSLVSPLIEGIKELYGQFKALVINLEGKDAAKDRAIASVNAKTAKLGAENAQLKKENALIKSYLCAKDQKAAFCKGEIVNI